MMSSDRQIYIHIGYPKTGNTFLKKEFFPRWDGVKYCEGALIREEIARIRRQDEFSYDASSVKANIEKYLVVGKNLISSEGLVGNPTMYKMVNSKLIADRLFHLFPDAKILIMVRHQYCLIESLYRQYIHEGGTKSLREFANFKNGRIEYSYCDWDWTLNPETLHFLQLADCYAQRFGKANVSVVPFELFLKKRKMFFDRLCSWIGVRGIPKLTDRFLNQGFGARQIAVARFLNRFLRSSLNETGIIPDVRLPFTGKIDTGKLRIILQSSLSRKWLGLKPITDELLKAEIKKMYASENKVLNEKYDLRVEEMETHDYF